MSYRKSLIRRGRLGVGVGQVEKADFIQHATRFIEIFEEICGPCDMEISLYTKVPYFTTFMVSDAELENQRKYNQEGMRVLENLSQLPDDFSGVPYVELRVDPTNEDSAPRYAFGTVNYGALLPSHILFYAQPDKVADPMKDRFFPDEKAPRGFRLGDGFEKNTHRYAPGSVIENAVLPGMLVEINEKNNAPQELR